MIISSTTAANKASPVGLRTKLTAASRIMNDGGKGDAETMTQAVIRPLFDC